MVKKLQKMSADKKEGSHLSSTVKDSAQQIWLAGLGAFAKAQQEGNKVFDTLVKEGLAIQRKTQSAAEGKFTEATSRMSDMASEIQSKAGNRWDKLENIFEERVAKALGKLGVPSAKEVEALTDRIDQFEKRLHQMGGADAAQSTARPATRSTARPARKAAAKTPAPAQPAAKKTSRPAVKRAAKKTASPAADTRASPAPGAPE